MRSWGGGCGGFAEIIDVFVAEEEEEEEEVLLFFLEPPPTGTFLKVPPAVQ